MWSIADLIELVMVMSRRVKLYTIVTVVVLVVIWYKNLTVPERVSRTELNGNKLKLVRELETHSNWKKEGLNFQSNNKARLPEDITLRQQLAYQFPYEPSRPFEKNIWQTWKVGLNDVSFPLTYRGYQITWLDNNPGYSHQVLADEECHSLIKRLYSTVPQVARAYELMPKSILKADFFRYLILFARGGVYSDIDTVNNKPINEWVSNHKQYLGKPINVGLVVGIEADPDRPDWNEWYARRIQFCQWTIQAKKGHPMLKNLIAKITELTLQREANGELTKTLGKDVGGDIMNWTGPGIWTDSVFEYMNNVLQSEENFKLQRYDELITWKVFTGMESPMVIDDVLILPITSFSPDVGQMGSKSTNDPYCYAKHMFLGSWKDDTPKHKPRQPKPGIALAR